MFNSSFSKLIHLTKDEDKVLSCLSVSNKSMSEISRLTKIPRTTLYTTVTSLLNRGLVRKDKIKGQTNISLIESGKINSIIFNQSSFSQHNSQDDKVLNNPDYKIMYGLENLISIYQKICNKKNERIYTIQPTSSMSTAVKKISSGQLIEINENVKKNKIIFDAIIHQNYMTTYMNSYTHKEGSKQTQKSILKSLKERLSDTSVIDNQYLNVSSEIFLTSTHLYILDWKHESCIEIANTNIVALIKEMFLFVKVHSKKIDYHRLIEESLRKL